jgi:hypothetical protein
MMSVQNCVAVLEPIRDTLQGKTLDQVWNICTDSGEPVGVFNVIKALGELGLIIKIGNSCKVCTKQ